MRTNARGPRLMDLICLVVGYGFAALNFRAVMRGPLTIPIEFVAFTVYSWFGLAISGPLVLLLDRRLFSQPKPDARSLHKPRRVSDPDIFFQTPKPAPPPLFTRSEQAWIVIGAYCMMMTIFLVPARLGDTPLGIIAVLQILSALILFCLGPRKLVADNPESSWTHFAAQIVLFAWPFAWAGMILILKK